MKKPFLFSAYALLFSFGVRAQLRVAIVGGAHQSTVIEKNDLPGWDSIKGNYAGRTGLHFGFVADFHLSPKSKLYFQPGVIYYNKGRKFAQSFDTTSSPVMSINATQYINYIDIPLNLVLKFGERTKFIIGGGPYLSFFYNGQETKETLATGGSFTSEKNTDVPVGDKPGGYMVVNYGVNALAGVEFGKVFLTVNYSRGLNDFYQAVDYDGSFHHQIIGGTLGIFLGRTDQPKKKIADKDGDGIPDRQDNCPDISGPAITNGCPDKDADGITDKEDNCPDMAGPARNKGCPILDTDKDGVNDPDDKCPEVAGVARFNGCPIPDTDKDGINDELDKCPAVAGVARYNGCPVPDADGDGVNDEEDQCPNVAGTEQNKGCPAVEVKKEIVEKVNFAARRIQFEYKRATLQVSSYKILDEVVRILKENPGLKILVEGHTSNDGNPDANLKLSLARAENVKAYLESKGIEGSRLIARGLGQTQPLNNGNTEAEKSQNRRVELKLSN